MAQTGNILDIQDRINKSTNQAEKDFLTNERNNVVKMMQDNPTLKRSDIQFSYDPSQFSPSISSGNNASVVPTNSIADQQDKLAAAQLQNTIAGLDKQKSGALSNLSAEQAKIQPMAIADRNNANIAMNNTNKSWSDFLATKGLSQSGSAALGTGLNQAQYLGNVGSINRDATNKESDILRRTTDVNNNYLADVQAARYGIEAQSLQNKIDEMRRQEGFARDDAKNKLNSDIATIGGYGEDFQAEYNRRASINPNDPLLPYLKAARQEKLQGIEQGKAAQALALAKQDQQDFENSIKMEQLKLDQAKTNYDISKPYFNPVEKAENYNYLFDIWDRTGVAPEGIPGVTVGTSIKEKQISKSYLNSPDFAQEITYINSNPNIALKEIENNAQELIGKYGYDGYKELLDKATPKTKTDIENIFNKYSTP